MTRSWLPFLAFGFLAMLVLVVFYYQSKPMDLDALLQTEPVTPIENPTVTFVNPAKGAENPAVTIVNFGDFLCHSCKQMASSLDAILLTYPDSVRVVWKNAPEEELDSVERLASIAAHCAHDQGRFWEYHDELFARQSYLSEEQIIQITVDLELDLDAFAACYQDQEPAAIIDRDYEEALGLGLVASPTLFINNTSYTGALSTDDILTYVHQALAQ